MNFKIALSLLVVVCVGYAVAQNTFTHEASNSSTVDTTALVTTASGNSSTTGKEATTTVESNATSAGSSEVQTSVTAHITTAPITSTTKPPSGIWSVAYKNNSYCILLKATISIRFKYNSTETHKIVTNTTNVPSTATANGSCEAKDQWIQLSFFDNWSLKMVFHKTNDSKYYQSEFELTWVMGKSTFPNAPSFNGTYENKTPMFNTSKAGYLCTARITVYDNSSVESGLSVVFTEKLQLEAFQMKSSADKFSDQYERCKEDTISNLVPIIVGACLGGLIIIVLIAYLIGRKRSRRGYESV